MLNENPINTPQPTQGVPLPLKREDKLKIYGITSVMKDVPEDVIKDKFTLTIVVTYTQPEALIAARQSLTALGKNPDDYKTPFLMISADTDKMVQVGEIPKQVLEDAVKVDGFTKPLTKEKSIEQLISYVRYVFGKTGTAEEKKVAEEVIKKFQTTNLSP